MGMLKEVLGKPGYYEIEGLPGIEIELRKWKAGGVFDTEQPAAAAVTGTTLSFFQSISNKTLLHRNFDTPGKVPAHTELIVNRVGLHPLQAFGNLVASDLDIIKIVYGGALTVKFAKDRTIAEGPGYNFPFGKGVVGSTTRSNTGVVTNGVAGRGATEELLVAQPVDQDDQLLCEYDFDTFTWLADTTDVTLDQRVPVSLHLDGLESMTQ